MQNVGCANNPYSKAILWFVSDHEAQLQGLVNMIQPDALSLYPINQSCTCAIGQWKAAVTIAESQSR